MLSIVLLTVIFAVKPNCNDTISAKVVYLKTGPVLDDFLNSKADCADKKISEVILSCYSNKNEFCMDGLSYCEYLRSKITAYFDANLGNQNYNLKIEKRFPNKNPKILQEIRSGTNCYSADFVHKSTNTTLKLDDGTNLFISLEVCSIPKCS